MLRSTNTPHAPGSYVAPDDRWGSFAELSQDLPEGAVVVIDRRVARLHRGLARALRSTRPRAVVELEGAERTKSLATVERIAQAAAGMPRSGTLVAVGGGTIGDVATVAAHLLKRGVSLVHVPTTALAAVDSSLGGKGAVNGRAAARGAPTKNALGVFHYPDRTWVCPDVFSTLSRAQLRDGAVEAWKMAACLDAATWDAWIASAPALESLIREARRMKAAVCAVDPYEQLLQREVLNFGHTFGHVIEGVTRFRVSHGDAVGLGMLCALDVGRATGVTPDGAAHEVEDALRAHAGVLPRSELAKALKGRRVGDIDALLRADKKAGARGELRMVLLRRVGDWTIEAVSPAAWRGLLREWSRGRRP